MHKTIQIYNTELGGRARAPGQVAGEGRPEAHAEERGGDGYVYHCYDDY